MQQVAAHIKDLKSRADVLDVRIGELREIQVANLEAAKLRATCEALERHAPGTPEYAAIMREEVSYEDRKALGDAMWAVALADGGRDEDEEIQLLAIETALGLTDKDMASAREKALRTL